MSIVKKPLSILLVEDDDVDAMSIQRAFRNTPLAENIVRARDGQEALDVLKSGDIASPFVVLLDLNMPRMDGFEFLQHIRSDDSLTHAVIFVLTTSQSEKDMLAAYKQHIAGYLVKQSNGLQMEDIRKLLEIYENKMRLLPPLVHS